MFSKEAIYTDARRKGFSHEQVQKIVYAASPALAKCLNALQIIVLCNGHPLSADAIHTAMQAWAAQDDSQERNAWYAHVRHYGRFCWIPPRRLNTQRSLRQEQKEKRFDDETLRFKRGGRAGHLLPDSWKDQRRVRKAWMR